MADLLITNGTILDGAGNPGFHGAVAIEGDRLRVLRGDVSGVAAGRSIDATGLVVAPGFIDMHSHSGLVMLAEGNHEPKVRQGVTTEVIGIDGCSFAPFASREDLLAFVDLDSGLDGRPDLPYDWDTVASYLSRFDGRTSVNVAFLVGNSALRIAAVGWDPEPASAAHIASMRSLLREAMQEGAFGMSTGLDYPPGAYASTGELASLGEEAASLGGFYHTHVRYNLGDRFLDPFREAIEIGRRSGIPVHLTHFYRRATYPGGARSMLELVEDARAEGLDVTFDCYPYEWSSTRLSILLPSWLQDGGPAKMFTRLEDPALRSRIRDEVDGASHWTDRGSAWASTRLMYFHHPANAAYEGRTITEIAELRNQHPADVMCDLLVMENLAVAEVGPGPEGATMPKFVAHPHGMVGTDSIFLGERPSPRTYGSFPRILGQFVRDERLLSLEEAVRKMTSYPAQRLGLTDRGLLRDGMKADITVFDPKRVRALATYENPKQFPEGIEYVVVNGEVVVDGGTHTGARPGRALRRGR
jgi:N-acyl-D-amino-acid deacylase